MNISTEMTTSLQKKVQMMKRNIKSVEEQEAAFASRKIIFTLNIDTLYACVANIINFFLSFSIHNCTKIFFNDVPL